MHEQVASGALVLRQVRRTERAELGKAARLARGQVDTGQNALEGMRW
jgi:hypothetical protein